MFSLKQKTNQMLPGTIDKIKLYLFKKTVYGSFRQEITMGNCKTIAIQADLGIFTHIPAYSGIFKNYSGIFRILCNHDIFRTLAYSEPWHIQKPGIFRALVYSESNAY